MKIPASLQQYKHIQLIAKETIGFLRSYITVGMAAQDIITASEQFMRGKGVESFWYHNLVACVLIGPDTTKSVSGRDYQPTGTQVQPNDLVTVDVSPAIGTYWGDFARSFIVENGKVVDPAQSQNRALVEGLEIEDELHRQLQALVQEDMTFEQVYLKLNEAITSLGYENLDFKGNLGHSIAKRREDQAWLEAGDKTRFSDIELFTFEPHIRKRGGAHGFKREDTYYFEDGQVKVL